MDICNVGGTGDHDSCCGWGEHQDGVHHPPQKVGEVRRKHDHSAVFTISQAVNCTVGLAKKTYRFGQCELVGSDSCK